MYHGCYKSMWSREHTSDVSISEEGVLKCRNDCETAGFAYFGFECPMETKVHCECSNTLTLSDIVDDLLCQQFNPASGSHCKGPFSIDTEFGTYYMGAGGYNSAYAVKETISGASTIREILHQIYVISL